mmetsp:Transcript_8595/g.18335  ORF Transcript_8595/g.18335 Transcript_8595/m.18335 type:complete len:313 (-) Transcript_8595:177-1115(-)|eukprot:CAMPEP_0171343018 /NCGR_PEP_ID=MMETSP0878-20121228/16027_1 /TAXON_ID=67004 /ORGANISM="Thalassiosira weissflogii, Strain CCMP1336" /LENGTH=312 /DNA_ID=CAMNT_0011845855 /DNA_START=162 /DNA_END=1100 /DNA_ORIENTATION=+
MPSKIRSLLRRRKRHESVRHIIQLKSDPPSTPTPSDEGEYLSDTSMSQGGEQVDDIIVEKESSESSERPCVQFSESTKSAAKDPVGILPTSLKEPEGDLAHQLSSSSSRSQFGRTSTVKTRTGVSLITAEGADHFSPSLVKDKNSIQDGHYKKEEPRPKVRPAAKSSAFSGPVRYDWMDVETTAAIKIQAASRRLITLKRLDEQGLSTSSIRNRRRKIKARKHMLHSEDVPFPFSLCGVGFLFGDGTLEDERVITELEKKKLRKIRMEMERREAEKRKFRMRRKESQHLEECIEVVETFDGNSNDVKNQEEE